MTNLRMSGKSEKSLDNINGIKKELFHRNDGKYSSNIEKEISTKISEP